jgi:hypothetical protein
MTLEALGWSPRREEEFVPMPPMGCCPGEWSASIEVIFGLPSARQS